jgi:hypothetical protein
MEKGKGRKERAERGNVDLQVRIGMASSLTPASDAFPFSFFLFPFS